MKHILLGVTGSPLASEAAELAEKLSANGYAVDVILTRFAARFAAPEQFRTAGRVSVDAGDGSFLDGGLYLTLAERADLAVVAPASAAAIAKLTSGTADDLLTAALLAVEDVPVLLCPEMDPAVYRNPITQRNRRELENLGYFFFGPGETGRGKGALARTDEILERIGDLLDPASWGAYI